VSPLQFVSALPRIRRIPPAQGARLFDRDIASRLGIASGPLLNAKWIAGAIYARYKIASWLYAAVRGDRFWEDVAANTHGVSSYVFWPVQWVASGTAE